jgi:predicted phage terminase large subunit-like protein
LKGKYLYLLAVYRRKLDFPSLKRAVREQAKLHGATIVLIEDKASGSSLIQELRAEHFSLVQAAPALDGDKVMRLRAQTAKIEGGFVLFPKEASWLDSYLNELLTFPNSKMMIKSTLRFMHWRGAH